MVSQITYHAQTTVPYSWWDGLCGYLNAHRFRWLCPNDWDQSEFVAYSVEAMVLRSEPSQRIAATFYHCTGDEQRHILKILSEETERATIEKCTRIWAHSMQKPVQEEKKQEASVAQTNQSSSSHAAPSSPTSSSQSSLAQSKDVAQPVQTVASENNQAQKAGSAKPFKITDFDLEQRRRLQMDWSGHLYNIEEFTHDLLFPHTGPRNHKDVCLLNPIFTPNKDNPKELARIIKEIQAGAATLQNLSPQQTHEIAFHFVNDILHIDLMMAAIPDEKDVAKKQLFQWRDDNVNELQQKLEGGEVIEQIENDFICLKDNKYDQKYPELQETMQELEDNMAKSNFKDKIRDRLFGDNQAHVAPKEIQAGAAILQNLSSQQAHEIALHFVNDIVHIDLMMAAIPDEKDVAKKQLLQWRDDIVNELQKKLESGQVIEQIENDLICLKDNKYDQKYPELQETMQELKDNMAKSNFKDKIRDRLFGDNQAHVAPNVPILPSKPVKSPAPATQNHPAPEPAKEEKKVTFAESEVTLAKHDSAPAAPSRSSRQKKQPATTNTYNFRPRKKSAQ